MSLGAFFSEVELPSFPHVNKVDKKGTMPLRGLYLEKSSYQTEFQMRHIDREVASPNREYAYRYKEYLELNNRKPRTTAKRMNEIRFILRVLPKDAKLATRRDVENAVMAINKGKSRDINGNLTNNDLAILSKRKLKQILRAFYKWLLCD